MVEVMKIMVTSFKRSHECTVILRASNSAAGHHQPTPLLETPGHSQTSLDQSLQFSSVQSLSCVWLFVTPWIAACQASLSITISRSSLKLTSIESVMPSSHLILCHPLFLLPPISSSIRVFSNESTLLMRWPKYWSFSFSIIPSKEYPGLISFRMDWLDLLTVQGTLKSLLQHHSSKYMAFDFLFLTYFTLYNGLLSSFASLELKCVPFYELPLWLSW